jgi:hypothetical protein
VTIIGRDLAIPEFVAAIARLAELLEGARPMPLMRNRVRVDKQDADALIDSIVAGGGNQAGLVASAGEVRRALKAAPLVPFTNQVRLSSEMAHELARALRSAAA